MEKKSIQAERLFGVVRVEGKIAKRPKIAVHLDRHVCGKNQENPGLRLGRKNGLAWAVVTWDNLDTAKGREGDTGTRRKGDPAKKEKQAKEPVTINQKGCFYTPHILVVRPDQEVLIQNSDPALHTTGFEGLKNYHKTLAQAEGAEAIRVSFPHPEPVHLFCDVHDWMSGWIYVTEAAGYRITDKDGRFSLDGIAHGTKLRFWHEVLGTKEIEYEGGPLTIIFDAPRK